MTRIATIFAVTLAAGIAASGVHAQQSTFSGEIMKVDEASGTITLKRDRPGTVGEAAGGAGEDFKVSDGLVFNAVRPGEKVRVTVESADGKMTITKLEKE